MVQFPQFRHRPLHLGRCRRNLPLVDTDLSKRELESILDEAANLLEAEGYADRGEWMRERRARLVACEIGAAALPILDELRPIWGGMGSFSDLSWSTEARSKMWHICDRVSAAIDGFHVECTT